MNVALYIAKRLSWGKGKSFVKTIIRMAIAGISISVAVMIISSSVIRGFSNEISNKIFSFWGTMHITDTQINTSHDPIPIRTDPEMVSAIEEIDIIEYQESDSTTGGDYNMRETKGGVKHIQSFALESGIIKSKKFLEGIVLKGVADDFDWSAMDEFLIEGRQINLSDSLAAKEIIVSSITADRLELEINDKLIIQFIKDRQIKKAFKVVGIYNSGLEEYDRRIALVDMRKIQEINSWAPNQIGGYEVQVEHIDDLDILTQYIYESILPDRVTARTIKEKFPSIFEWLELQKMNEWVILALMIVVCVITMITSLLILILERTKMIGILKSLGSDNWSIRKIFLYQGALILAYGLLIGNILGIGLCYIQEKTGIVSLDEKNYYLSEAPVELYLPSILLINVASFVIVMLCLIIPTIVISSISPVKVLRFQ